MRRFIGVLAVSVVLAACGGGGGGGEAGFGIPGSATKRAFTRSDGAVSVIPGLGGFTATQVITLSNGHGGAAAAVISLLNENGDVVSNGDGSAAGYEVEITLSASAPTEQQARAALETMTVRHVDAVGGGTLYVQNEVEYARFQEDGVSRSASVSATFPALISRLYQRSVNGSVQNANMVGRLVRLDSTNGDVVLEGNWDRVELGTVNGTISASPRPFLGDSHSTMHSTNGNIEVTLGALATCPASGCPGYDLQGRTTNGTVTINVEGAEPVGEQGPRNAHHRSPGYASSNRKISVGARTGNGNVTIQN